jgi:hypothetical protein
MAKVSCVYRTSQKLSGINVHGLHNQEARICTKNIIRYVL